MPRHGIGQPLHLSQLGSTHHDRVTSPQIRSSYSMPLDRPRQSASRHPPVATNRPRIYRVRRPAPLIQQPFHRPPACRSASTPFTHLIRGTQIPIAQAAPPTCLSHGFLPWRFAYAGPRCTPLHRHGTGIRKPSQKETLDNTDPASFWPVALEGRIEWISNSVKSGCRIVQNRSLIALVQMVDGLSKGQIEFTIVRP